MGYTLFIVCLGLECIFNSVHGFDCNTGMCRPGEYLGKDKGCVPCPTGTFMDEMDHDFKRCKKCSIPNDKYQKDFRNCSVTRDGIACIQSFKLENSECRRISDVGTFMEDETDHFCLENEYCSISYEFRNIPKETLRWFRNVEPISSFTKDTTYARVNSMYCLTISSKLTTNGKKAFTTLTFFIKDTEEDGTIWDLVLESSTLLFRYNLRILSKVTDVNCYIDESQVAKVTCMVPKSYPKLLCDFDDNTEDISSKIIPSFNVNHVHERVPGHPYYLISKCSIPLDTNKTKIQYNVTIYPNVTGSKSDFKLGVIKGVTIKIEQPKVTFSCETAVNEDDIISCTCKKSDASNLTTKVTWSYNSIIITKGNNTATLRLRAQLNLTNEIVCFGSNILGWKSNDVYYNITIQPLIDSNMFRCPSNRPHRCGFHGLCYDNYQFCTKNFKVESCFPLNIDGLEFCQRKDSREALVKIHPSCRYACLLRFGYPKVKGTSQQENVLLPVTLTVSALMFLIIVLVVSVRVASCRRQKQMESLFYKPTKKDHERKTQEIQGLVAMDEITSVKMCLQTQISSDINFKNANKPSKIGNTLKELPPCDVKYNMTDIHRDDETVSERLFGFGDKDFGASMETSCSSENVSFYSVRSESTNKVYST